VAHAFYRSDESDLEGPALFAYCTKGGCQHITALKECSNKLARIRTTSLVTRRGLSLIALPLGCTLNVAAGNKHSYLFAW